MLSKKNRLTTLRFKEVFDNGTTARFDGGMIKYIVNDADNDYGGEYTPRASVVVSKKILKSAVKRNLLKRRVYNFLSTHLAELPNLDFIYVLSKSFIESTKDDQKETMEKLLEGLGGL